jgi:hypothetical protein
LDHLHKKINIDAAFDLESWLKEFLDSEVVLSTTKKRHRDHLLHACRIAILGEKILLENNLKNENKFKFIDVIRHLMIKNEKYSNLFEYYDVSIDDYNKENLNSILLQSWYISSLFHDVGYIYEAFRESWKNLRLLDKYPKFLEFYLNVESSIINFQNSFKISDIKKIETNPYFIREFDHGVLGAYLIRSLLGDNNLICDLAALIAESHTSSDKIEFSDDPLPFLLVILDEIQEWERPVLGRKMQDQALAVKIKNYCPYIDNQKKTPELEHIKYEMIADISKPKNELYLGLKFELDYGNDVDIINDTGFSYPIMLYLKYKNLQRLKIDNEKLKKAVIECIKKDISKVNLDVSLKLTSDYPLVHLWDRQCNILMTKALKNNNHIISNWLAHDIKYRDEQGTAILKIPLKRTFDGNFQKIVLDSHLTFSRDKYIHKKRCEIKINYSPIDDQGQILCTTTVAELLKNKNNVAPIYGLYTCLDEVIEPDSLELRSVEVNKKRIFKTSDEKVFYKLPVETEKKSRQPFREAFGGYIPFSVPMIGDEEKEIKMDFEFKTNIKNKVLYDGIFNTRNITPIENPALIIEWEKNIYDKYFRRAIKFKGTADQVKKFLNYLKFGVDVKEKESKFGETFKFDIINHPESKGDYYKFDISPGRIDPYFLHGFAWDCKPNFFCQSCGKLMRTDRELGTNNDGSKNSEYCMSCYENGKYIYPDMTFGMMKEYLKESNNDIKEVQMEEIADEILPSLKRWKT